MSDHITREQMNLYCARAIPIEKFFEYAKHIDECKSCGQLLNEVNKPYQMYSSLVFDSIRDDEHYDREDLELYLEGNMTGRKLELFNEHLQICEDCNLEIGTLVQSKRNSEFPLYPTQIPIEVTVQAENRINLIGKITRALTSFQLPGSVAYASLALILTLTLVVAIFIKRQSSHYTIDVMKPDVTKLPSNAEIPVNQGKDLDQASNKVNHSPALSTIDNDTNLTNVISEGRFKYSLDRNGNLIANKNLSRNEQKDIIAAFVDRNIIPPLPKGISSQTGVRRGVNDTKRLALISPYSTTIHQDRPTLRWKPVQSIKGYVVTVIDQSFNVVAKSPILGTSQWLVSSPLERDQIYMWQVNAVDSDQETSFDLKGVGSFKVISSIKAKRIRNAERTYTSRLALGVLCAREGLLDDAERHFKYLLKLNPGSKLIKKLLTEVKQRRGITVVNPRCRSNDC